jgi:hypothetical protein
MPKKKTAKKTPRERKIKDRFDLAIDADLVKKLSKIVEAGNFRYVAITRSQIGSEKVKRSSATSSPVGGIGYRPARSSSRSSKKRRENVTRGSFRTSSPPTI